MLKNGVHRQIYATICGNIMTFCFGLVVGWPSSTLIKLQSDDTPLASGPLTVSEAAWTSSIMCIGGAFATVIYGWTSEKFGRRASMLCLGPPTLISWLFIEFGTNVYHLYISRFLGGFAGGGSFILVPVYVTEISSDHVRGILGSLTVLCHNIGILVAYITCSYTNYYTVPFIGIISSIFYTIWCYTIPESPKYLLEEGRLEEGGRAWEYFNDGKFNAIEHNKEVMHGEKLTLRDFCEPAARRGLALSVILITLTCSSGCFVFLHYMEPIFVEAGSTLSPQLSSIIVATIQMSGSYMATFLVEKAGRKLLIICSSFGAAMCLTVMGIYSLAKSRGCDVEEYNWLPLLCLSGVVFIAAHGSASLPYVVVCEILGQKIRAFGTTICWLEDWVLAFLYVYFLPFIMQAWGMFGATILFAAINMILSTLLFFFLPETKGKSIEEITTILSKRVIHIR